MRRGAGWTHLRQRAHELQHAVLEAAAAGLAALLHEGRDGALALAQLRHGEGAQLVEAHHRRHGGEDEARVHVVAVRGDGLHNLVSQLLDEDEGADEEVAARHVLLELGVVLGVTQLLQQVAHHLRACVRRCGARRRRGRTRLVGDVGALLVQVAHGGGERRLVLRLQHDVHDAHLQQTASGALPAADAQPAARGAEA